jgi:DNA-binding transcriptional MerR regulator
MTVAWSTRELARLTATTVKTIRYYHQLGILDEPERMANGYKQYGVSHLVRVLRVKRLSDLGVPLAEVATMDQAIGHPDEALRTIDAELKATIERLEHVRAEIGAIRKYGSPTDLPPGFSEVGADLSEADRAIILIYSAVFDRKTMDRVLEVVRAGRNRPEAMEFDELPADADDERRREVAQRFAVYLQSLTQDHPWLSAAGSARGVPESAGELIRDAVADLYNPAQIDVLQRAQRLLGGSSE